MILLVLLFFGGFVAGQDRPCGYTTVPQSRVIGGEDAIPGAWPWQIALLRYGRFICGGSLISANWVVTAAHCVSGDQDASSYQVVVGDHNRNINEGTEQKIAARRIFGHPSYNRPSRFNNDIALIQLMSSVSLSKRVNPICLPNNNLDILTGSKCFITGWGKIKHPGGSHHTLQQAMMPPIDQAECRRKIQETGGIVTLTPQMLCAGVKNTRLSGCHGDSGGPYVCLNADQKTYTLHGAVSWGSPTCNSSQLYTVFARVTQFLPWIKQHTEHGDGGGGSSVTTPAGSTGWSCGFEDSSICNFTQEKSDTFDWRQNKGSTSSSNTGPSSGHGGSGYYMYIETSYPRQYGDYATLISPVQKFSKIMCLTFYYHMYGSAIGNLTVSIDGEVKFFKAGNQGNQWVEAKINIDVCGDHPVIFTATRGKTYTGDIAIDDISLKQGSCTLGTTPPQLPKVFKCSFDNSTCGLKQSRNDTFDWTRHRGPTPSSFTGPSSDHSSGNGYYMYIEASSPRRQGDYAVLSSPALLSTGNTCITFYYHMYGSGMGNLTVNVNGRVLFRKSGNQGDRWILAEFDNYIVGVYKVVFNATRGSSFQSDIAIDDVIVRPGSCLSVPASSTAPPVVTASPAPVSNVIKCSFSTNSSCGFTQSRNDKFDWTRHRGITTSSSTGPSSDHTGGNGYYMYIETSSPRKQGDYAELLSPAVRFGGQTCLQFFYHMYGATIGGLLVFVDKKNLFSKIGNQGNKWLDARINISKYGVYKVSFVGVRGSSFTGDIAIDDISLRPGPCLPGPPTVQPCIPPLPASCGLRPHTRIVGGTVATPGSWPWQTMLRSLSGFQFCGGTLVSDEYVITAAHCIGSNPFQIRLGAHKRTTSVTGYEQDFNVSKVITHPLYQFPQRFSHDIAIVKLSKPAQLNRRVHPACLPLVVPAPVNGERCWITGWGRTSAGGPSPDVLLQASVPIVSRPRCDKAYPNQIHDSMICAGLDQGGIDSCQGDSGGPMVCETGGRYYLHGVTSWGHGCALPNKFGVYAKVTYRYLLDWIMSEIAKK